MDERLLQGTLGEKTHDNYYYWLNPLIREYGNRLICQITTKEIKQYLQNQLIKNSQVSSNKYLSVFKKAFAHGQFLHAVTVNSVSAIKQLSEKDHERNRFLLPNELNKLIEASQKNWGYTWQLSMGLC